MSRFIVFLAVASVLMAQAPLPSPANGGGGGGGGAPTDATYITQTANGSLSAEQALGALATGCLGSTTTTGVVAARTITGTANEVSVANGDCSGTPTLSLSSTFDISGKTSTKPVKTGTSLPGTCGVGELYLKSDATAAAVLYACTATDTWTQQTGTGGGAPTDATYITQTANGSLSAEQALSALASGLVINTTTTGVLTSRTLAGGTGITVADGDGQAGNPTVSVDTAVVPTLAGANTFTGTNDATGASRTAPSKAGTSLPGTCTVADTYIKTDATNTNVLYVCTATNTWTAQGGGGGTTVASAPPYITLGGTEYIPGTMLAATVPPGTGWTAINSASISTSNGARYTSSGTADSLYGEYRSIGASTEAVAGIICNMNNTDNSGGTPRGICGILGRTSGGAYISCSASQQKTSGSEYTFLRWTNGTTYSAAVAIGAGSQATVIYFKWTLSGSQTQNCTWSLDGIVYNTGTTYQDTSGASGLTITDWGWFTAARVNTANNNTAMLVHWATN